VLYTVPETLMRRKNQDVEDDGEDLDDLDYPQPRSSLLRVPSEDHVERM
jgi:hypothetical protein